MLTTIKIGDRVLYRSRYEEFEARVDNIFGEDDFASVTIKLNGRSVNHAIVRLSCCHKLPLNKEPTHGKD